MVQPRPLARPPIVEALLDLRAAIPGDPAVFNALAEELNDEFPTKEEQRNFEAKIEVREGRVVSPRVETSAFGGVRLATADRKTYAQFRPDGFTLNNMTTYMGGDQLLAKALTLWEALVERAAPQVVSRVSLRYINRLELPLKTGDSFTRYLTSPPSLPKGAPSQVSQFLSRIVGHDAERQATAVVIQQLKLPEDGQPVAITVDIDVFRAGDFPIDSPSLREILDSLRMLKNETFFSLLTDETVSFYE